MSDSDVGASTFKSVESWPLSGRDGSSRVACTVGRAVGSVACLCERVRACVSVRACHGRCTEGDIVPAVTPHPSSLASIFVCSGARALHQEVGVRQWTLALGAGGGGKT